MKKAIKIFDAFFAVLCSVIFVFVAVGNVCLPDSVVTYGGDGEVFNELYSFDAKNRVQSVDYQRSYPTRETVKLLGIVPVKTISVTSRKPQRVYVSGESFGIKLYTNGVIVVGTQSVDLGSKRVNPAQEAGIEVGDVIIQINGVWVFTSDEVQKILNDNNGQPYTIKVKRKERYKTFTLTPVYSDREGCYKAGMWVRDSTAGIGTITFYNKESGTFAALGHQVNDVDTNEIMPLLDGEAVSATVTSVDKGSLGETGSLCCDFEDFTIGKLTCNSECGVYGTYSTIGETSKPYTVAAKHRVQKGYAQILTTIDSGEPRFYDIEITHISLGTKNNTKNIVFKVTDKELIEKTGGIVQGMSGSPIIQNDKLVGAVTHVIINNPRKGYAIFAQTMLDMSNDVE